jgi:hypothetical protein
VAWFPEARSSAAGEFIDLSRSANLILDPWQQYVLDGGLGERAGGRWAAMQVGCWVPRQNGKGGIAEALELGWLFLTKEELVMHSAHEYKTAAKAFIRLKTIIQNCPDLDRRVNRYWQANGEQGIELTKKHGGARLQYLARSGTSGRGFTGSKNLADEAQELEEQQMAAVLPTMAAMDDPQTWFFGTPPRDGAKWCYGLRKRGLARDPLVAWYDWGADLDLDKPEDRERVGDKDVWYETSPALGGRIREEFVESVEFGGLTAESFAAERLGVWPKQLVTGGDMVTADAWGALKDEASRVPDDAPRVFAIEVSADRTYSTIAAYAGRGDGALEHAELVEHKPGTAWVPQRAGELDAKWRPALWVLDPHSEAATLIGDLAEVGIAAPEKPEWLAHGNLYLPTSAEYAQACGQMRDAIRDKDFVHIGQQQLATSATGARKKAIGGASGVDRARSLGDAGPFVGVALARWAFRWRRPEDGGPGCW